MGQKIIMSVTTDLVTDQRVHKTASTLTQAGFEVMVLGRQKKDSLLLEARAYPTKRFKLPFEKGFLFYANYNLRLFWYLLFSKADILHANDLDTLLPMCIIARWRKIPLVYDSHEYFTGVPEIQHRPLVKHIWEKVEAYALPKVTTMYTVNNSIAELYEKKYQIPVGVVRNIPPFRKIAPATREELKLPKDKFILIIQGSGINVDRGAEEVVESMQWVEGALLLIVGSGDVIGQLKSMVTSLELQDKVWFIGKVPYQELIKYTSVSDLGLAVDKNTNINYQFSLPNKLFDFIHAKIPILSSHLTEIERIISSHNIGTFIDSHQPEHIASVIKAIMDDRTQYSVWKSNLDAIHGQYSWETEEKEIQKQYEKALKSRG